LTSRSSLVSTLPPARAAAFLICLSLTLLPATGQERSGDRFLQPERTFRTREEWVASGATMTAGRILRVAGLGLLTGSTAGIVLEKSDGSREPFPAGRLLPWNEVTVLARQRAGMIWIGTTRGAIRYDATDRARPFRYFAGKRWLPADTVSAIGFEKSADAAWIETPAGFARIEMRSITLEEKARVFEERVEARHLRHGFVASSRLVVPGDTASNRTVSSDNDGLWTAMHIAAECYRYKATGSPEALAAARRGILALIRLEQITGIPGFPARSFIRKGVDSQPADGEWHDTPDGLWRWKGDTSSDEIVGHYYAFSVYYDLVASDDEKTRIREVVDRITAHILDNGYHLIDTDGKHTRWGWWAPDEIWADPDETGLRALHMLSHLRVAHHITGKRRYLEAYNDLVTKHRYALLTRNQKISYPGHTNHSDDELAFLSYEPLLRYETGAELRKIYLESLERAWLVERPEWNPLWNFIYAAGTASREYDRAASIEMLRQIPMDLVSWEVRNSHRLDLPMNPAADRFGKTESLTLLPADERPMMKWNGNPFVVDGGDAGRSEDDGVFFLLPYWMGRYYGLID
jgi:hypothetical protein